MSCSTTKGVWIAWIEWVSFSEDIAAMDLYAAPLSQASYRILSPLGLALYACDRRY